MSLRHYLRRKARTHDLDGNEVSQSIWIDDGSEAYLADDSAQIIKEYRIVSNPALTMELTRLAPKPIAVVHRYTSLTEAAPPKPPELDEDDYWPLYYHTTCDSLLGCPPDEAEVSSGSTDSLTGYDYDLPLEIAKYVYSDSIIPDLEVEMRDLRLTSLRATSGDIDLTGSNPSIDIKGDITVFPNKNHTDSPAWMPLSPIEYRIKVGHPDISESNWIVIDSTIQTSQFLSEPTDDGVIASLLESVDLTPLVQQFAAISRPLPSILLLEGRALLDTGSGSNIVTPLASSTISDDSRNCRKDDCEPDGSLNTYGYPSMSAFGLKMTGCIFDSVPTSFGYGWQHSAYKRVEEDADLNLTYHDGNGMIERWIPDGNGDYIPAHQDNYIKAVKNVDDNFTLTHRDQSVMDFDSENRVETWTDPNNNVTTYTYENGPSSPGRLTKVDDGHGREQNFAYSGSDPQPISITSHTPSGGSARVTSFEYYQSPHVNEGRLKKITDPAGETTEFAYTAEGRIETVTDTRGEVAISYTYYPSGHAAEFRVETETNYGERRKTFVYDDSQNKIEVTEEDLTSNPSPDQVSEITFDDYHNVTLSRKKVDTTTWNETVRFYEDGHNPHLLTKQVSPQGAVTTYIYSPSGNLVKTTDALGNETSITYAEQSDPTFAFPDVVTSIKRADVTVDGVTTSYDETSFEYNATTGNLEKVTDALGNETSFTYTSDGLVENITDARGHTTVMEYGGTPRVLQKVKVPKGLTGDGFRELDLEYDGFDNVTKVIDDLNNSTTSAYDALNRLTSLTDARGQVSTFTFTDGLLEIAKTPDPNVMNSATREAEMLYDSTGRLTEVLRDLQAGGQESRVGYDYTGFSQLRTLTRKRNSSDVSYEYSYDMLGRLESAKDPLYGTSSAQTEMAHRPFCIENSTTSARGVRTIRNFDLLCRLTQVSVGDPNTGPTEENKFELATTRETRTFEYDELGRMVKSVMPKTTFQGDGVYGVATFGTSRYSKSSKFNQSQERTYQYDALDRLTKVTFEDGNTMEMEYDAVGNVTKVTDPDGKATLYEYYRDNLLHKVKVERNSLVVAEFVYTYDDAGRPATITYPTGTNIVASFASSGGANGWNENGQLVHLRYLKSGVPLRELEYDYDGAGNRISQIDKTSSGETHWKYTYDWFDRLIKVEKGPLSSSLLEVSVYSYDESDNITELQLTQDLVKFIYSLDDASNITKKEEKDLLETVTLSTENFTSDLDGNLTSREIGGVTTTYVYDDFNKLIEVSSGGSLVQENRYSANGFRRTKKASGEIKDEYASGLMTALAKTETDSFTYIKGPSLMGFEQGGNFYWFLTDALGSVRDIVDSTGTVVQQYEFDERGNHLLSPMGGGPTSDKNFVGGLSVNDDTGDSGLYLMGHRHYDPSLGRFLNRDPIGFAGGLNQFSYAGNSPVTRTDHTGLNPTKQATDMIAKANRIIWEYMKNRGGPAVGVSSVDGPFPFADAFALMVLLEPLLSGGSPAPGELDEEAFPWSKNTIDRYMEQQRSSEDDDCNKKRLALGVREHLTPFAAEMNAMTWKNAPNADKWLLWVAIKIADPNTEKVFLLEGVPGGAWAAASRGAANGKKGYATDYELFLVSTTGKESTRFYRGTPGNYVEDASVFK